ncbi:MAG: DUF3199 family protein [Clostridiales bacterium]|nr:DUF3199 family protein [Clostridiales bacterium]
MAVSRPWVTPAEVIAYTTHEDVAKRSVEKLAFDIARAELKVIAITNNRFDDESLEAIPEPVKMAVILLAEAYAKNTIEAAKTQYKSETNDDYSSIAAIEAGQTFFSVDDEGAVILEYDINSRVTFDEDTPEDIRKNRPLRVYDTFANDLLINFRPGKYDNDDDGWAVVEGLGRSMLQNYEDDGAITGVDLDADFLVDTGKSSGDSMYVTVGLQAVDSADKFYFDVIAR